MLYIPKCIYFYLIHFGSDLEAVLLYIPKCIYFYEYTVAEAIEMKNHFTFQNVSISTGCVIDGAVDVLPLHSKMYLFLPKYVLCLIGLVASLHSKMYLFLRSTDQQEFLHIQPLHSKMYLFLPCRGCVA